MLSLNVASDVLVAETVKPRGNRLPDVAAAVIAAMANPLDLPPLVSMVLPDDTVVVPLQEGLPCAPDIIAGAMDALVSAKVLPEQIRILRAISDRTISPGRLLRKVDDRIRNRIEVLEHDPEESECLSYLAASQDDHPVYVSRALVDADVVLPVGTMHAQDQDSCLGIHHGWFPTFADKETQLRFRKSQCAHSRQKMAKRRAECNEAAWMLGVLMSIQLIPAGNDQAISVIAGASDAVGRRVQQLVSDALTIEVDRRASLVVAAIGGGPEQQTWSNLARSVDAALEVLEEEGSIAICSRLRTKPGPALRRLAGADGYEDADRAIRRKPTPDAYPAARLNRALQRARVYLLSDLDEQVVESLGLAYVASAEEIGNLSSRHESCLVLEDAQHISTSVK